MAFPFPTFDLPFMVSFQNKRDLSRNRLIITRLDLVVREKRSLTHWSIEELRDVYFYIYLLDFDSFPRFV